MIISQSPLTFEPTRAEVVYLDGLDRLDHPTPVFLEVNSEGIEATEMMPGTRSIKIPADDLIEAKAIDASIVDETNREGRVSFALYSIFSRRRKAQTKRRNYVLTITYRSGEEKLKAVFRREDEAGFVVLEKLSRLIALLVETRTRRDE